MRMLPVRLPAFRFAISDEITRLQTFSRVLAVDSQDQSRAASRLVLFANCRRYRYPPGAIHGPERSRNLSAIVCGKYALVSGLAYAMGSPQFTSNFDNT